MGHIDMMRALTLVWLFLTSVFAEESEPRGTWVLKKRMISSSTNSDSIRASLHYPYRSAGFATTPYSVKFSIDGALLQPLEEPLRSSKYARFIHNKGFPVFSIKHVGMDIIRQGLVDHERIYYYYLELHSGDLIIEGQSMSSLLRPSRDSTDKITAKVNQKEALLAAGTPADIVDLVHGKPFSAPRIKNWAGFRVIPRWSKVQKKAEEIIISQEAGAVASDQDFDRLRKALSESGMVKLTHALSGAQFGIRLDKLGDVQYKILRAST